MQKVLIISYYFPPSNFVGGERTNGWAKNLHEFGFYPIIITRKWDHNQTDIIDVTNNKLEISNYGTHEVHRLPIKKGLKNLISKHPKLFIFRKILTFLEMLFSNFFITSTHFSNFYIYSKKILANDKSINILIISGRPFQAFNIGYKLKNQFNILWIPDYRDEWNSHNNITKNKISEKLFTYLEKKSEIKWLKNADFFLSVSDSCVNSINKLINKKGFVVMNGYSQNIKSNFKKKKKSEKLTITYAGTLYSYQKIETLIETIKKLDFERIKKIEIYFIGVNVIPKQLIRIKNLTKGFEDNFILLERMPKEKLNEYIYNSDILFLTSYEKNTGWIPVKLLEYYSSKINILLCPSDKGEMEKFILNSNSGFIANNIKECDEILKKLIDQKSEHGYIKSKKRVLIDEKYSRHFQTKILSKILLKALKDHSLKQK